MQRFLELQGDRYGGRQPGFDLLLAFQDDRHGFGMIGRDHSVGISSQEAEKIGRDLAFLELAHRGPGRPDPGKKAERLPLIGGKPHWVKRSIVLSRLFREGRKRHYAAMRNAQPAVIPP